MDKWISWQNTAFSFAGEKLTSASSGFPGSVDKLSTSSNKVDEMCIKANGMGITIRNCKNVWHTYPQ